jgi:hypothetical protein
MLGRSIQEVQASGLEPYGIALFNDTDQTIIAAILRTTLVDRNGKASVRETIFANLRLHNGRGVTPNGNEVAPHSSRILTPVKSFSDSDGVAPSRLTAGSAYSSLGGSSPLTTSSEVQELAQTQNVVVSLDLVVFEDGRLVGPDESSLVHNLQAQLQVEREMALTVREALSKTRDMRDIREVLTQKAKTDVRPRVQGPGAAEHWRDFFTVLTSNHLLSLTSSQEQLVARIDEVLARPVLRLVR